MRVCVRVCARVLCGVRVLCAAVCVRVRVPCACVGCRASDPSCGPIVQDLAQCALLDGLKKDSIVPRRPFSLSLPVRSVTRGHSLCFSRVEQRTIHALRTNSRAQASMPSSGERPSTGPPSMNNALPSSSNSSKKSVHACSPPDPSLRSHVQRSQSRSRNYFLKLSNSLQ